MSDAIDLQDLSAELPQLKRAIALPLSWIVDGNCVISCKQFFGILDLR